MYSSNRRKPSENMDKKRLNPDPEGATPAGGSRACACAPEEWFASGREERPRLWRRRGAIRFGEARGECAGARRLREWKSMRQERAGKLRRQWTKTNRRQLPPRP